MLRLPNRFSLRWLVPLVLLLAPPAGAATIAVEGLASPGSNVLTLMPGETTFITVVVSDIPAPGLAAFQFDLAFDPGSLMLADPNDGSPFDPFVPLGGDSFCDFVRGQTCPDPAWFLTSTGRDALLANATVDNAAGFLQAAFATQPGADPPVGGGALALIELTALDQGITQIELRNVILSDNGEPPMPFDTEIHNLTVMVVPEPGTFGLLALGLAVLGARRRR